MSRETDLSALVATLRERGVRFLLRGSRPVVRAKRGALTSEELARLKTETDALVALLRAEREVEYELETPQERWVRRYGNQRPQFGNEFSPAARAVLLQRGKLAAGLEPGGIDLEEAISRRR